MSPRVKKLYNAAKKDKTFVEKFLSAEEGKADVPGMFSNSTDRALFATVYYGYLIATKGDAWESAL